MATVHVSIEITGDDAMLVYKAAKALGISTRKFVVDAAVKRAQELGPGRPVPDHTPGIDLRNSAAER